MGDLFLLHKVGYLAILYWHPMLLFNNKSRIFLLSIYQQPSMPSTTVIWQELIALHLTTEKGFWWNFHYSVDTTSNIPSQWAFYDLSNLLTSQGGLFRLRSIRKKSSLIHFNTCKISCVLCERLVKMTDFLIFQSWFLLIFKHSFT